MNSIVDYLVNNENKRLVLICLHYDERQYLKHEICCELAARHIGFDHAKGFIKIRNTKSNICVYPITDCERHLLGYHCDYLLISSSIDKTVRNRHIDTLEMIASARQIKTVEYISKSELDRWDYIINERKDRNE